MGIRRRRLKSRPRSLRLHRLHQRGCLRGWWGYVDGKGVVECDGHKDGDVSRKEVVPGGCEVHHCSCDSRKETVRAYFVFNTTGSRGAIACDVWCVGLKVGAKGGAGV